MLTSADCCWEFAVTDVAAIRSVHSRVNVLMATR